MQITQKQAAGDSKLVTTNLGAFTAGNNITVYIAVDSRVTGNLPAWMKSWTKTSSVITTSNNLKLELFKKNVKSGENVTLGTNGGNGNSVNYIVLAVKQESMIKGDVNLAGIIDSLDIAALKKGLMKGFTNDLSSVVADVDGNGKPEAADLQQIQDFVLGRINQFTKVELPKQSLTPEEYMNKVMLSMLESEPNEMPSNLLRRTISHKYYTWFRPKE